MAELIRTQINIDDFFPESLSNLQVFKLLLQFMLSENRKDDKILSSVAKFEEYNQSQLQKTYYELWFQKMVRLDFILSIIKKKKSFLDGY